MYIIELLSEMVYKLRSEIMDKTIENFLRYVKIDTQSSEESTTIPSTMAVATPTIFPVPMVAASSVVREENEDTPLPSVPFRLSGKNTRLSAAGRFFKGRNRKLSIR